jgi:hypothetical protein
MEARSRLLIVFEQRQQLTLQRRQRLSLLRPQYADRSFDMQAVASGLQTAA